VRNVQKSEQGGDMSTIDIIAKACPDLSQSDLRAIEDGISEISAEYFEFARGEALDSLPNHDDYLWIVVKGNFVVYAGDIYISEIGPGRLVGEQAPTDPKTGITFSISADRVSAALRMRRSNWLGLLTRPDQCKAWGCLLISNLSDKLARMTTQFVDHVEAEVEKERLLKSFVSDFSLGHVKAFLHGDVSSYKKVSALTLFSDLEGFSRQIGEMDPVNAGGVTRSLLQVQAERLSAAGAHLDKFMGDGVMAYWIADHETLDPKMADIAVDTAFAIRSDIAQASGKLGLDIGVRVGMHFGRAIAGNFGSERRIAHTLIGADVNLAARYEQVRSMPDEYSLAAVRISPVIYDALSSRLKSTFSEPTMCRVKHGVMIEVRSGPLDERAPGPSVH